MHPIANDTSAQLYLSHYPPNPMDNHPSRSNSPQITTIPMDLGLELNRAATGMKGKAVITHSRRRRMSSSIFTTDDEQVSQQLADPTMAGREGHPKEDHEIDLAESDGQTTEELIGADGRPNARAMMFFKWPVSVGAVDPRNTLTPGRCGNGFAPRHSTPQHEPEDLDDSSDKLPDRVKMPNGRNARALRTPRGPVAGTFQLAPQTVEPTKTAVITGQQPALPSPYPRSRRSFSSVDRIGHSVCIQGLWSMFSR